MRLYKRNDGMDKFRDTYKIPSARLQQWDYGSPGLYFITICTQNREHFFGEVIVPSPDSSALSLDLPAAQFMKYTPIGELVHRYWQQIPQFSPYVEVDAFIIMPNHLHGILFLNKPNYQQWQPNTFGPQSQNLASVIRGFKAAVKKYATTYQIPFAWQSRFYDRVIRSEKELQHIRAYIYDNPLKWEAEKNNPENLWM